MTIDLLLIAGGLVLLYLGAEGLVGGSSSLALRLGLSPLLVGLTVVAFGTSTPELTVSLLAALDGQGAISVGNVVGSNICNIGLILGLSALVRPLRTSSQIVHIDVPLMIGVTVLAVVLLAGGSIGRATGALFCLILAGYCVFSIRLARRSQADVLAEDFGKELRVSRRGLALDALWVVGGLGLLVAGSRLMVDGAVGMGRALGWSEAVIGLTVVAVGTSLPELAASVLAAVRGESDIAIGNIVGSNIFNLLAILGLSALAHPIDATGIALSDLLVMLGFAVLLWPLAWWQRRICRWEAVLLLALYAAYVLWLLRGGA